MGPNLLRAPLQLLALWALRYTIACNMFREHVPNNIVHPTKFDLPYALTILNQPLDSFGDKLYNLWDNAVLRATTDGGTNRLYEYVLSSGKQLDSYIPDFINGDFDSINQEIKNFYQAKGCEIIPTPDQDHTDFTKCVQLVLSKAKERNIQLHHIVAVVDTTGRFDHIMGNIETLYLAKQWTDCPIYLLSSKGLTWLMDKGHHRIKLDKELSSQTCGLIPIGSPCEHVTTTGLKWNLDDQCLQFGHLVSTSNTYDGSGVVTVALQSPLVWTMEIN